MPGIYMIQDPQERLMWQRKLFWHGAISLPDDRGGTTSDYMYGINGALCVPYRPWLFNLLNMLAWIHGYGIDEGHYDWKTRGAEPPWSNMVYPALVVTTWHVLSYFILCHYEIHRCFGISLLVAGCILVLFCHQFIIEHFGCRRL